jgi:hypothetical protein
VGKRKRADVYLEVRKRRGHIFFECNKCLCSMLCVTMIKYIMYNVQDYNILKPTM